VRARLKTEVADQAADRPPIALQLVGDDVEIAHEPLTRSQCLVAKRRADQALQVIEVPVKYFQREDLFGTKVVGERTLRGAGGRADVADAGRVIPGPEQDRQPRP